MGWLVSGCWLCVGLVFVVLFFWLSLVWIIVSVFIKLLLLLLFCEKLNFVVFVVVMVLFIIWLW